MRSSNGIFRANSGNFSCTGPGGPKRGKKGVKRAPGALAGPWGTVGGPPGPGTPDVPLFVPKCRENVPKVAFFGVILGPFLALNLL